MIYTIVYDMYNCVYIYIYIYIYATMLNSLDIGVETLDVTFGHQNCENRPFGLTTG